MMQLSHEPHHKSLFVQRRGDLRRALPVPRVLRNRTGRKAVHTGEARSSARS